MTRLDMESISGWASHSGGQTTLSLTPLRSKANLLKPLIANIHAVSRAAQNKKG